MLSSKPWVEQGIIWLVGAKDFNFFVQYASKMWSYFSGVRDPSPLDGAADACVDSSHSITNSYCRVCTAISNAYLDGTHTFAGYASF